jgi:hypothetical protein
MEHKELLVSYDLAAIGSRINGTHDLLDEIARLNRIGIGSVKIDTMRQQLTVERDELLDRYIYVSESETPETN